MAFVDFSSYRFLLVDDFPSYRSMLRSILQAGHANSIDDVGNAAAALEMLAQNSYDVVLCDYNLGDGQDGQQLLEEAKHRNLLPNKTVWIMVTAENTMAMVMGVVEYRPDDYLSKPFTKEVLKSRLDKILKKKNVLNTIHDAFDKGEYDKALSLCNQQLKAYPKMAFELAKLKGRILDKTAQHEKALAHYEQIIKLSDATWAKLGRAQALVNLKQYQQAESALKALVEDNPNLIEAYDLLCECQLQTDQSAEALDTLKQASKISPKAVFRQQKLAQVALQNDDSALAERAYKNAIREGKHSVLGGVDDHMGLAKLYIERNEAQEALKVVDSAQKQFKKDPTSILHTQLVQSMAFNAASQDDKAIAAFQKAISGLPEDLQSLPESLLLDSIAISESLGEDEIAENLRSDINGDGHGFSEESKNKYLYLLLNGEGIRLYKNGKVKESIDKFEKAAEQLTDNVSVNLNAAQSMIIYMRDKGVSADLKEKARDILDRVSGLALDNDRYQQLEKLYAELR